MCRNQCLFASTSIFVILVYSATQVAYYENTVTSTLINTKGSGNSNWNFHTKFESLNPIVAQPNRDPRDKRSNNGIVAKPAEPSEGPSSTKSKQLLTVATIQHWDAAEWRENYSQYLAKFKKPVDRNHFEIYRNNVEELVRHNECSNSKSKSLWGSNLFVVLDALTVNKDEYDDAIQPTWSMGINLFTDMTKEELQSYMGYRNDFTPRVNPSLNRRLRRRSRRNVPKIWDYRDKGVISPVKDQGSCGACFAFAAVACMESKYTILTNNTIDLSEQHILDCTIAKPGKVGNRGCNGGSFKATLEFMQETGLDLEVNVPYIGSPAHNRSCEYCQKKYFGRVAEWRELVQNDEIAMMEALYEHGPIVTSIVVDSVFSSYRSGIFSTDTDPKMNTNHAVLIVGYGREKGLDVWYIKNSWGPEWGMDGFMTMRRNVNLCKIGESTPYAIVRLETQRYSDYLAKFNKPLNRPHLKTYQRSLAEQFRPHNHNASVPKWERGVFMDMVRIMEFSCLDVPIQYWRLSPPLTKIPTNEELEEHRDSDGEAIWNYKRQFKGRILRKSGLELPRSFDYRDKIVISPAKEQDECGCGFGFAAAACLNNKYKLWYNQSIDLSGQHVENCQRKLCVHGCNGTVTEAFTDIFKFMSNVGVYTKGSYTNQSNNKANTTCQPKQGQNVRVAHWSPVARDEDAMREALYLHGPIVAAIQVDVQFLKYTAGVCTNRSTNGTKRAVLIVGYGQENGTDVWHIQNFWGNSPGPEEFTTVKRNVNFRGIADGAYAILEIISGTKSQHSRYLTRFKKSSGRNYSIFKTNFDEITYQNSLYMKGDIFWWKGLNVFTDMTEKELEDHEDPGGESIWRYQRSFKGRLLKRSGLVLPKRFDYRDIRVISPAKEEAECGSSFAFAAVACLESKYALWNKETIDLRVQHVVDCQRNLGPNESNGRARGGFADIFEFMSEVGVYREANHANESWANHTCQRGKGQNVRTAQWSQIEPGDEDAMREALVTHGPIVAAIEVDELFFNYTGGVFANGSTSTTKHAVLVVGYGRENGTDVWYIQNCRGKSWGVEGFMTLKRNVNLRGIADGAYTLLEIVTGPESQYSRYLTTFKKPVGRKYSIFKTNLDEITSQNSLYMKGDIFWWKGINVFTDMTDKELEAHQDPCGESIWGYQRSFKGRLLTHSGQYLPKRFDYRDKVDIFPAKPHVECGCSFACAAVACLKSKYALLNNQTIDLREQYVVDCQRKLSSTRARYLADVFEFMSHVGVYTEANYANQSRANPTCQLGQGQDVRTAQWSQIDPGNEDAMREALVMHGPIVATIEVDVSYTGGVFANGSTNTTKQAVLIVGYGRENGTNVWYIQNFGGYSWGQEEFSTVERNVNYGGIADGAYALLEIVMGPEGQYSQYLSTFKKPAGRNHFQIFQRNLNAIISHNSLYMKGVEFGWKGLNVFTDMTDEELKGHQESGGEFIWRYQRSFKGPQLGRSGQNLPRCFDYRDEGVVLPVKKQVECGCSFAYTAVACLESKYALWYNKTIDLRAEHVVHCQKKLGLHGCSKGAGGGFPDIFKFMSEVGVDAEVDYPFAALVNNRCQQGQGEKVRTAQWRQIEPDEEAMREALYLHGPIVATVEVDKLFFSYTGGVFTNHSTNSTKHAVLIVGYGQEDGTDVWYIQNCWGKRWGQEGFMALERNVNLRGIADGAYALLEIVMGPQSQFSRYLTTFKKPAGRNYTIFQKNFDEITDHNSLYINGDMLWWRGINVFTDMTKKELEDHQDPGGESIWRYQRSFKGRLLKRSGLDLPNRFDYRDTEVISPAKQQVEYDCSFTFAAVACLESKYKLWNNQSMHLSGQHVVDCKGNLGPNGNIGRTTGGFADIFEFMSNLGVHAEADYPYSALANNRCQPGLGQKVRTAQWSQIEPQDEETMREALYLHGPIVAAIEVDQQFLNYTAGACTNRSINGTKRAVLIVGYGQENGMEVWYIQNFWGKSWGREEFTTLQRNVNHGGIADEAHALLEIVTGPASQYSRYLTTFRKSPSRNFSSFQSNFDEITYQNSLYMNGVVFWWKGINVFTDMTHKELEDHQDPGGESVWGYQRSYKGRLLHRSGLYLPKRFDYRDKGLISAAKQQVECGCSFTLAAVACLESKYKLWNNQTIEISAQHVVDCQKKLGPNGSYRRTRGGYRDIFEFMSEVGVYREANYKNQSLANHTCQADEGQKVRTAQWSQVEPKNEEAMREALVTHGPIVAVVEVDELFFSYKSGVFAEGGINTTKHAVLIVGYGQENGTDVWYIQNFWGNSWGQEGFMTLKRNVNLRGIANEAYGILEIVDIVTGSEIEYSRYLNTFKKPAGRNYSIFKTHFDEITNQNSLYMKGDIFWWKGINVFTDMTDKELEDHQDSGGESIWGYQRSFKGRLLKRSGLDLPNRFDYRDIGVISRAKQEAECGCSFAFAAVACLESKYALWNKETIDLRAQHIVDCQRKLGQNASNERTTGGFTDIFEFMSEVGVYREANYKNQYWANHTCQPDQGQKVRTAQWSQIEPGDEVAMKEALVTHGPIVTAIEVDELFFNYTGGVFANGSTSTTKHAVLVVGYGRENGMDVWYIHNCGGKSWGMEGFMTLKRNVNIRGIANMAYALLGIVTGPESQFFRYLTAFKKPLGRNYHIFQKNFDEITDHNSLYMKGDIFWWKGINVFTDMTDKELEDHQDPGGESIWEYKRSFKGRLLKRSGQYLPKSFDYRDKGVEFPAKQHAECGCSFAFAAVACLEIKYALWNNQTIDLREQYVVDCQSKLSSIRARGFADVFEFISEVGVYTEAHYATQSRANPTCQPGQGQEVRTAQWSQIDPGNEDAMREALVKHGPIVAAIEVDVSYTGGVFANGSTNTTKQAVLIVGYGRENRTDVWYIQNFRGSSGGQEGFTAVKRNANYRGIADGAYALLEIVTGPESQYSRYLSTFKKPAGRNHSQIFQRNLNMTISHNSDYMKGLKFGWKGINVFTDMDNKEQADHQDLGGESIWGYNRSFKGRLHKRNWLYLPKRFDYRDTGVISPAKQQVESGCSFAFAAVACLECKYALWNNQTIDLRAEHVVYCQRKLSSIRASGFADIFEFMSEVGVDMEEDYLHQALVNNRCQRDQGRRVRTAQWSRIEPGKEEAMREALVSHGPILAAIEVDAPFFSYTGGILDSISRNTTKHAVLIVGYGRENGTDVWYIKNCWGKSWGVEGFMTLKRNVNLRGIADVAYALLEIVTGPESQYSRYLSTFKKPAGRNHFQIFERNLNETISHNRLYMQGVVSSWKGINVFTDMTKEELKAHQDPGGESIWLYQPLLLRSELVLPKHFDYRVKYVISPAQAQVDCSGSEELWNHEIMDFSGQQAVDCQRKLGLYVCSKGAGMGFTDTFKFISEVGVGRETDYRFHPLTNDMCQPGPGHKVRTAQWSQIEPKNEDAMREALYLHGPIVATIEVDKPFFSLTDDVLPNGSTNTTKEAVLIVGYGQEDGKDVWYIQNCCGNSWGEDGFMTLKRNENFRGIADGAYAILEIVTGTKNQYSRYLARFKKPPRRNNSQIFQRNLNEIISHNSLYLKGGTSWYKGINLFTDMTSMEMHGYMGSTGKSGSYSNGIERWERERTEDIPIHLPKTTLNPIKYPETLDYRDHGVISPVTDQGDCGCGFAFAGVASMESQYAMLTKAIGAFVDLSEQQIMDCGRSNWTKRGYVGATLEWMKNVGVDTETNYLNSSWGNQSCDRRSMLNNRIVDWEWVYPDEFYMQRALQSSGPIVASIAVHRTFFSYGGGVYNVDDYKVVNHAVLIVGYGRESGVDVWYIKNSWGEEWGQRGFMTIRRNVNLCRIAEAPYAITSVANTTVAE